MRFCLLVFAFAGPAGLPKYRIQVNPQKLAGPATQTVHN
jgi:hypothetical protein